MSQSAREPSAAAATVAQPGDLALLTGPEAGEILAAALHGAGGEVLSWQANQVDHQPRRGSTAGYRVRVRWADGTVTQERFGAVTGEAPDGALTLGDGAGRVSVWRFPHDPYLPALAGAYDTAAVARLLRGYGMDGPVRLTLRAYRPRRRAVIEAAGPRGRLFLKVVRPSRVERLHRRHRLLTSAGVPAAPSLGYTPAGLLALQELPGRAMRDALRRRDTPLPPGGAIMALLDLLPAGLAEGRRRRSWLDRVEHYAAVVAGALPEQAELVRQLGAAISAEAGTGPTVPVHGDFYENQLRIDGERITGLLDVDTVGPGDRLDDLGCLLGHLSVLTHLYPERAAALNQVVAGYLDVFARQVDPVDLRYRVAAVVLSLATGPHRVQEKGWQRATRRRLDLVERWLDGARAQGRRG